jgi:RNA polymerase sigma-70 factor (ECF subfamily)
MSHAPDDADFDAVVMPHVDAVYRMARRLAGDPADADDLLQETFLRALRAFDRFQLRDYGARPWLMKILHNVFYSRIGRERKAPGLIEESKLDDFAAEESPADGPNVRMPDGGIDWDRFDEEIMHAVESLPAEFREALLLWSVEELSYRQIAEVCEVPIGTVMSRLHRARGLLSKRLSDYAAEQRVPGAEK